MIKRLLEDRIPAYMDFKKAIVIKGARQVGKTTLLKALLQGKERVLWVDGDDPFERGLWSDISREEILRLIRGFEYIVFDEAQRIVNIGLAAKMILDAALHKQVFISGSSSLDLASSIHEPLTGRKWTFELYPLSWEELVRAQGLAPSLSQLDSLLITGLYPEVYTAKERREKLLRELADSYLYKDVLEYGGLKKPEVIVQLLQALAFQLGQEVSYHELAKKLRINHETVQRYIRLLEDSYVLFRLRPLSRNRRKEIFLTRKIYFYDLGIRNAVINAFRPLSARNDVGALWENFIIMELVKKYRYAERGAQFFFWRSKSGSEVDFVVQEGDAFYAYEMKYKAGRKLRFPPSFTELYQPEEMKVLNRENFYQHI